MNTKIKYLNEFHKKATEAGLKQMEEWAKNPISYSEALRQVTEMHRKLKETYPDEI